MLIVLATIAPECDTNVKRYTPIFDTKQWNIFHCCFRGQGKVKLSLEQDISSDFDNPIEVWSGYLTISPEWKEEKVSVSNNTFARFRIEGDKAMSTLSFVVMGHA